MLANLGLAADIRSPHSVLVGVGVAGAEYSAFAVDDRVTKAAEGRKRSCNGEVMSVIELGTVKSVLSVFSICDPSAGKGLACWPTGATGLERLVREDNLTEGVSTSLSPDRYPPPNKKPKRKKTANTSPKRRRIGFDCFRWN